MYIYIFTFWILFCFHIIEVNTRNQRLKNRLFLVGAFIVTFILAFRGDNVGGDTMEYCQFFDGKGNLDYGSVDMPSPTIDVGFVWFCRALRTFGDSHWLFIFSTSLITIIPFLYLVWRDSQYKILPLCLYIVAFNILTLTQTSLRQDLSLSVIMCIYILLSSSTPVGRIKYFIIPIMIVISILLHITSVITLLLGIIIYYTPLSRKKSILLILCSLLIAIIIPHITQIIFSWFYDYSSIIDGGRHVRGYEEEINQGTFHKMLLVDAFFVICVIWASSKEQFEKGLKGFPLRCLVWGCVFVFLGNGFILTSRMVLFFTFLGITSSPKSLILKRYYFANLGILLSLFCFEIYQIWYLSTAKSAIENDQLIPYYFIFE